MSEESNNPDLTPGIIAWSELVTNDKGASVAFYSDLLGWSTDEIEMPDGKTYTMFKQGDRPVAGCVVPPEDSGAMPMWLNYINVEDIDASLAKAKDLGAVIHKERVDLPMGSFAVLSDPQGTTFAFWQGNAEGC